MFEYEKDYKFSQIKYELECIDRDIIPGGTWPTYCNGRIVTVLDRTHGYIDGYLIHPDWCVEVNR